MTKDNIVELCNHIHKRQNDYGADEVFRFHAYFNGKQMVEAEYDRQVDDERAKLRASKQKAARKDKGKAQQQTPINETIHDPRPPFTVPRTGNITPLTVPRNGNITNLPQTTIPNNQIDPALLGEGESTYISGPGMVGSSNNRGQIIEENEMQMLIANGYPNTIPINGPNDGPPRYYVPVAALDQIKKITAARLDQQNTDNTPGSDTNLDDRGRQIENSPTRKGRNRSKKTGKSGNDLSVREQSQRRTRSKTKHGRKGKR